MFALQTAANPRSKLALIDELSFSRSLVVFAIRNSFFEREQEYHRINEVAKKRRLSTLTSHNLNEIYGHSGGTTMPGGTTRKVSRKYLRVLDRIIINK